MKIVKAVLDDDLKAIMDKNNQSSTRIELLLIQIIRILIKTSVK